MKKIFPMALWVLIMALFAWSTAYAGAFDLQAGNFYNQVHFGRVTATTETVEEEVIYLPNDGRQMYAVEIWAETFFSCTTTATSLPTDRLALLMNGERYQLSHSPTVIHIPPTSNKDNGADIPLRFSITLRPEDQPGSYTTTLKVRPFYGTTSAPDVSKTVQDISVTVEVVGWILLQSPTYSIPLTPNNASQVSNIANLLPYTVQVAANVPWALYGYLDSLPPQETTGRLQTILVKLAASNHASYQNTTGKGVKMSNEPTLLAQGSGTVSGDQYWVSIPITFQIQDYIHFHAGRYEIPLSLIALERKP